MSRGTKCDRCGRPIAGFVYHVRHLPDRFTYRVDDRCLRKGDDIKTGTKRGDWQPYDYQ